MRAGKSIKGFHIISCVLLVSALSGTAAGRQLRVAAAADLQFVFEDVSAGFQNETGHAVELTFGSSGNFFSQIQNAAPLDPFFSADSDYPAKLQAAGIVDRAALSRCATARIVLWTRRESAIDVQQRLKIRTDSRVPRISFANPDHAPYGRAAVTALQHEKIYDQVRNEFVLGEHISQAAQFVESGNADIGILALSLAVAPSLKAERTYYEIPAYSSPAIDQAVVILKSSKHKDIAQQFLTFLKRPDIAELMRSNVLKAPESHPWQRKSVP